MTTDPIKLKGCPFCNAVGVEHHTWSAFHHGDRGYSQKYEHFRCIGCGVEMKIRGDDVTLEQAAEQWNTRAVTSGGNDHE